MDDSSRPAVRVICGPTAAGKTRAAFWFAQRENVSIVSADSRQLYRAFDIGTAKPTREERVSVPHYGIDVLDPEQRSSSAWWADSAAAWIDDAESCDRIPLVVGGTGLYLRSLFGVMFREPDMDGDRRLALSAEMDALSTEALRKWVQALDPERAHLGRTQLLRAAEIALLTGRRVSDLHRECATHPRRRARYLVIDPGAGLAHTIAQRTHDMLAAGWADEVRQLMQTVPEEAPAWNAAGYRTIRDAVRGGMPFGDAESRVVIETRQYAKRQRTWFRHQLGNDNVTRLSVVQPDWPEQALAWWNQEGRGG